MYFCTMSSSGTSTPWATKKMNQGQCHVWVMYLRGEDGKCSRFSNDNMTDKLVPGDW
jgi:hypothetical protein